MRKLGIFLLIVAVATVLWDYGSELIAADRCLDGGRVYDYQLSRCRSDVVHLPVAPYTERRSGRLAAAGVLAALGLGLIVLSRRGFRRKSGISRERVSKSPLTKITGQIVLAEAKLR